MFRCTSQTRNYDPISLEDIGKFDENWILEDDPIVLSVEEIELFRKGCTPHDNDSEINCNMNGNVSIHSLGHFFRYLPIIPDFEHINFYGVDDDLVIEDDEEDNDMDGANDHTNVPTADEGANDGHDDEDNDMDDDAPRGPSTIDWNFQYR